MPAEELFAGRDESLRELGISAVLPRADNSYQLSYSIRDVFRLQCPDVDRVERNSPEFDDTHGAARQT